MPTKRCCGCSTAFEGCILLTDTFDRADSTDLGSDWVVVSGTPAIVSNELELDSGEKIATVVRNPGSRRGIVSLPFRTRGSGPWELAVTLNYGGANECVATIEFSDTEATLTVGGQTRTITDVDVGQRDNLLWRRTDTDTYLLQIALTNYLFYVNFGGFEPGTDGAGFTVWDHEFILPTSGGGRLAIESVAGDVSLAYNYLTSSYPLVFYRHFDDSPNDECPDYACECTPADTLAPNRRWIPWRTRIDFFSDDGSGLGCDIFNGGYLIFEIAADGGTEVGDNTWDCVTGLMAGESYGYGTANPPIEFSCGIPTTVLQINFNPVDCTIADVLAADDIDSCDPFIVTYNEIGTTDPTSPCYPCVDSLGSYYAVMTDATP